MTSLTQSLESQKPLKAEKERHMKVSTNQSYDAVAVGETILTLMGLPRQWWQDVDDILTELRDVPLGSTEHLLLCLKAARLVRDRQWAKTVRERMAWSVDKWQPPAGFSDDDADELRHIINGVAHEMRQGSPHMRDMHISHAETILAME